MADKAETKSKGDSATTPDQGWFVRMNNGSTFGPINTKGLVHWACDGRIMPDDEISSDRINWRAARELPDLGMDMMIELPDGTFMGPYNPQAIDPLAHEGKIPPRSKRFHVNELEARIATRQMALFGDEAWGKSESGKSTSTAPENASELAEKLRAEFEEQIEEVKRQAKDSLEESERTMESLLVERDGLKAKLEKTEAALAKERARDVVAKSEADKLVAQCADLAKKLTAAEAVIAESDSGEATALAATCEELEEKLIAAEEALIRERGREVVSKADADQLAAVCSELRTKLVVAEEELARERRRKVVSQADFDRQVAECDELKTMLGNAEEALTAERMRSASSVSDTEKLEEECEGLKTKLSAAEAKIGELESEYTELLAFSNQRDLENQERIDRLSTRTDVPLEVAVPSDGLGSGRRIDELAGRVAELMKERDTLNQSLMEAKARAAISEHPVEGDLALIKLYADGALALMRKELEQEKERNTAARAVSADIQNTLHTEIERLERVMARDPGELSRTEQMEQRSEHQIATLQQELESVRRHHQADMARAEANAKAIEGRCKALVQKETLLREKLSRVEQRTVDYDSLTGQLRRKESALLAAEKGFEEARQQWQIIESTLQHRIEELERGAGLLFDANGQAKPQSSAETESKGGTDARGFRVEPWMRRMKRN